MRGGLGQPGASGPSIGHRAAPHARVVAHTPQETLLAPVSQSPAAPAFLSPAPRAARYHAGHLALAAAAGATLAGAAAAALHFLT